MKTWVILTVENKMRHSSAMVFSNYDDALDYWRNELKDRLSYNGIDQDTHDEKYYVKSDGHTYISDCNDVLIWQGETDADPK